MDFVSDALFDGRRFHALTVVEAYTRECLAIEVGQGLKADAVVATMERLTYLRGSAPGKIRLDTGRNSSRACWTTGPTGTELPWISPGRASQRTMLSPNRSTAGCETNA